MSSTARVEESGAFTLKKVASAIYQVSVNNVPAGAYLKSVQWNGREKLGEPIDLSAGVAGEIQVILGTDGATFDVKAMHGDTPARDATVVLLPEDVSRRNPEITKSEETNDTGHVVFKDVPPGNYLAFAWDKVENGDWFDPVFIKAAAKDWRPRDPGLTRQPTRRPQIDSAALANARAARSSPTVQSCCGAVFQAADPHSCGSSRLESRLRGRIPAPQFHSPWPRLSAGASLRLRGELDPRSGRTSPPLL